MGFDFRHKQLDIRHKKIFFAITEGLTPKLIRL